MVLGEVGSCATDRDSTVAAEFCDGTVRLLQTGLENLPKFYSLERLRQSLDNRTPVGERSVL